jgi:predicted N-acetyltransferase YhbS
MSVLSNLPLPAGSQGISLRTETPADFPAVNALIDRAFGPGRFAKTAERLREGNQPRLDLSPVAIEGGEIIGVCRQWPLLIGATRVVYLGPFAVENTRRCAGLGAQLINEASRLAAEANERAIILVGDHPYFGPLGFSKVPHGLVTLPGPVDPERVLWKPLKEGGLDGLSGPLLVPHFS